MGFVFITMVELAFVLLVKQFQDWKDTSTTICNDVLKPEKLILEGKTRDNKVIDSIKKKSADETENLTLGGGDSRIVRKGARPPDDPR